MKLPKVALATCKNRVEHDPDHDLLVEALRAADLDAEWIAWDGLSDTAL